MELRGRHHNHRTYIVDEIATISTKGQQLSFSKGEHIPKDTLEKGHQ